MKLDPKFNKRRKWAAISFYTVLLIVLTTFGIVIFGDEQTSKNLREAGIIIAPIVVCLIANVSHYMQLVSNDDSSKA